MGMGIDNRYSDKKIIQIKDIDGSAKGTISISKTKKKRKRLQYNHRRISNQLILSKTSHNAHTVMTRARGEVVALMKKQASGEYDEREVRNALIHARKMVRISRKKMKHLTEEEKAKQSGACLVEKEEKAGIQKCSDRMMEEKLRKMLEEYEQLMEELQNLKKKHRADEMKDIMDADLKYLKFMLDKMEKEKQTIATNGVSLQLEGIEMPVTALQEPAAVVEGGNMDISV